MTASSFINYMCIAYSTLVGLYCIVNSYSNESNSSETVNCLTNIVTMELKMSYLIILCCALIHMSLAGSDISLYHVFGLTGTTIIFGCKAVTYLLYPLLGWMADVCFTRYKFVLFSL